MILIIKQLLTFIALMLTFAFAVFIAFGLIAIIVGLLEFIKERLQGGGMND